MAAVRYNATGPGAMTVHDVVLRCFAAWRWTCCIIATGYLSIQDAATYENAGDRIWSRKVVATFGTDRLEDKQNKRGQP